MNIKKTLILPAIIFVAYISLGNVFAKEIKFSSPESRVSLIELYTSEGCSSCPPADKWLSKFQNSNLLWQKLVPVAFHVDYWDYLGWKDKFADKRFALRQYRYQKMKYVSAVYTPGVMKNGREWRGWRWWQSAEPNENEKPGVISAKLNNQILAVSFESLQEPVSPYILNIALLGIDITSSVRSGENSGEIFEHDFVVLDFDEYPQTEKTQFTWNITNPLKPKNQNIRAIAIWISQHNDPTPIQATGTWLN